MPRVDGVQLPDLYARGEWGVVLGVLHITAANRPGHPDTHHGAAGRLGSGEPCFGVAVADLHAVVVEPCGGDQHDAESDDRLHGDRYRYRHSYGHCDRHCDRDGHGDCDSHGYGYGDGHRDGHGVRHPDGFGVGHPHAFGNGERHAFAGGDLGLRGGSDTQRGKREPVGDGLRCSAVTAGGP